MPSRPPYRPAGDRVYQAIKARLIAYEFPQGRRILLEPIANSLGVSTTPVREAMNRLAERDLVIKAENKGFYAMTLTETRIAGSYQVTRLLLTLGLERLSTAQQCAMHSHAPAAHILNKLNRRTITDTGILARHTGEVFSGIARLLDNGAVQHAIDLANDHLYFVRTLECRYLEDAQTELRHLCELLLSGRSGKLVWGINGYHDRRLALLPKLLRDARL